MNITEAQALLEEARAAWQLAVNGVDDAMDLECQAKTTYAQVEQAFLEYERQNQAEHPATV